MQLVPLQLGDQHYRHFDAAAVDFTAELVLASMLPPTSGGGGCYSC
jgi:hypothetical protein